MTDDSRNRPDTRARTERDAARACCQVALIALALLALASQTATLPEESANRLTLVSVVIAGVAAGKRLYGRAFVTGFAAALIRITNPPFHGPPTTFDVGCLSLLLLGTFLAWRASRTARTDTPRTVSLLAASALALAFGAIGTL